MTTTARNARTITLALLMTMGCAPILAADPLGFYIGAGVGHSEVRNDRDFGDFGTGFSGPYSIDGNPSGWKLMAGFRPLHVLGAEVAYFDFGSVNGTASLAATPTQAGLNVTGTSHPKATALFAVGYLPIPLPYLDVFAKAGVAELKRDISAGGAATCRISSPPCAGLPLPILVDYSANGTSTHPAYGAGAQLKFTGLAVRAEYERISDGSGDVDLLSLGVTFVF